MVLLSYGPFVRGLPFSDRPISWQLATHFGKIGITATGLADAFERSHQLFEIHTQCVGDHTRGLFEAHASIVVSAAHPFEDGFFSFGHVHCFSSGKRCRALSLGLTPYS